jgi:hypothetical protein
MKTLRSINVSAAVIVLMCFFMPWVQVSCAGARDTLGGLDLARNGHGLLWFVPVLMVVLVLSTTLRVRPERNRALALGNTMCGLITLYLMNRERLRVHDDSGLISAQLTGWFWLGFLSALAVVVSGICMLVTRRRAP